MNPASALLPRHIIVPVLACVCLLSCGRKAAVRAPQDVLPQRITDLTASSAADGIQLSWSRPRTYADGSRMRDLIGFVVERSDGPSPSAPFKRIKTVDVSDRARFRQSKRFQYPDPDTTVGTLYRYRVVSFTVDRYLSEPSNVVTVERTESHEEKNAPRSTPRR